MCMDFWPDRLVKTVAKKSFFFFLCTRAYVLQNLMFPMILTAFFTKARVFVPGVILLKTITEVESVDRST